MMTLETGLYAFAEESLDMFERAEWVLLELEQSPENSDLIDEFYRIIHTIKGNAGVFGFEGVVGFCHIIETVLNVIRNDCQKPDKDIITLLLICCDNIMQLVDRALYGNDPLGMETRAASDHLAGQLFSWMGVDMPIVMDKEYERILMVKESEQDQGAMSGGEFLNEKVPEAHKVSTLRANRNKVANKITNKNWHLSLRFNTNIFCKGMDPLSFLDYLCGFGRIVHISTLADRITTSDQFDAEQCYLGFEVDFETDEGSKKVYETFDFVIKDSAIYILPPECDIRSYVQVIDRLPENNSRLTDILLSAGTINSAEYSIIHEMLDKNSLLKHKEVKLQKGSANVDSPASSASDQSIDKQPYKAYGYEKARVSTGENIRVDIAKFNNMVTLLEELQKSADHMQAMVQADMDSSLVSVVGNISTLARQVHELSLNLRMLPISEVFNRYRRVVRDLSNELHKNIELRIIGDDIEIDKAIAEKITTPLLHLIRNGVDHGIESSQLRVAKGKPEKGIIKLHGYYDSGNLIIEVSDDGKGLCRDKLLARALEQDVIKANQILTDFDVLQLIFEPGFSTNTYANKVSGRGFGMNIVRENIQQLGGKIMIKSQQDEGTVFVIQIPLKPAMVAGLQVVIAGHHCIIPREYIVDCLEFDKYAQSTTMTTVNPLYGNHSHNETLGQTPCICLASFFDGIQNIPSISKTYVVVISYQQQCLGLIVEQVLRQCASTLVPAEKNLHSGRLFQAQVQLEDGQQAVVLNIKELYQMLFVDKADMGNYKVEHYDFSFLNNMNN